MRNPIVFSIALSLLFLLPALAEPGAVRLESLIPAETDMVLLVNDVPRFLDHWPESPLGRAWNDPQVKRFLAPLRESMEIDRWDESVLAETGLELDEIFGIFEGQVALLIPDFQQAVEAEDGEGPGQLAMIAHADNHEIVSRLMADDFESMRADLEEGESLEQIEEEFLGHTLHVSRLTTTEGEEDLDGWAIVGEIAVVAEPKSYLLDVVRGLSEQAVSSPLAGDPSFKKVVDRVGAPDMLLYLNGRGFVPLIEQSMMEEMADPDNQNPMSFAPEDLRNAMALDVIESLFLSSTLAKRATHVDFGVQYGAERGLLKLLAFDPGPVKPPGLLPDDAVEASVGNFSLTRAWEGIKEMLATMNPGMGAMMEVQLSQLSSAHGVDLEKGIFGSLGNQMVTAKFLRPVENPGDTPFLAELDQLVGVSVTDRQSLEMGLEALKSLMKGFTGGMDPFDATEYLGYTIFTMKQQVPSSPDAPDRRVAYTLTEDYFLLSVGTQAPLKGALSRRGQPGRHLWSRPDVKKAVKALPRGASGWSFYDTEKSMRTAIEACGVLNMIMADEAAEFPEEEAPEFCDPSAKPDPTTIGKYFGPAVGAQYKDGKGLHFTIRVSHPER